MIACRERRTPADQVRAIVARSAGDAAASRLPDGYHRMGRVLLLRLPDELAAYDREIGRAWQHVLGVETVLVRDGPIDGELRRPRVRILAGAATTTQVTEHGVRYRFDAARTMFAAGNRTERQRIARLVRPGEAVADLFAGIGYFSVPIAAHAAPARLAAVEKNPEAFPFLQENLAPYASRTSITTHLGDNREVSLPTGEFDRIILGYLPSSEPWIPRALALARPSGAWIHVHRTEETRHPLSEGATDVAQKFRAAGATIAERVLSREVKPYGPGRRHVVVDVHAIPGP